MTTEMMMKMMVAILVQAYPLKMGAEPPHHGDVRIRLVMHSDSL